MKLLLTLLCLACMSLAFSAEERKQWVEFKRTHGKSYETGQEENLRFSIFEQNLRAIEDHNQKFAAGKTTYSQKVTRFADLTKGEFVSMLNRQTDTGGSSTYSYKNSVGGEVPESMDWREKGAVSEVRDQGNCGSSWIFSVIGTLEGFNYVNTNELVTLSGQQLMDCSSENGGCNGGTEETALEYVKKYGVETEESYPYGGNSTCNYDEAAVFLKVKDFVHIEANNEGDLLTAVGLLGPVSVGLDATYLAFYDKGVFNSNDCSQDVVNHAVLAVGYSKDEPSGLDYWLVKNSWGKNWGEDGYFKIKRGVNECGIASYSVYPVLF